MLIEPTVRTMSSPITPFRALVAASLVALATGSVAATTLSAQAAPAPPTDARPPRAYGDLNFLVAQPVGQFDTFVSEGYGLNGAFIWNFDRDRVFGVRMEGGFLQYDSEERQMCFPGSCRVGIDLTTTNGIVYGGIGPQISVPSGWVRPYMNGTIGFSYFHTESSVSGDDDYDDEFNTTNHDDLVFAVTGGGGFLVPLSLGRTPVLLDLGVVYHRNGEASYLRSGSIIDHPDGSITIRPIRSEANFVSYRIGVSLGFR